MHLKLSAFALLSVVVVACSGSSSTTSSSSSSGGSSGNATPVSAKDCQSRCEAKASQCGASASDATAQCQTSVCNTTLAESQVACLENASCDTLAKPASSFADICPPPTSGGSSGSSGTSGTSGSGGGSFSCNGKTCDSNTEYCGLTYDSTAGTWKENACVKIPDACKDKSLCGGCLKDNSGCPTSGTLNLKCSSDNGNTSFGCE